jgi:acetyl esterase/lipase
LLTHADLPYVEDGHPKQVLDVYLPPGGDGPFPTLLVIHGLKLLPGTTGVGSLGSAGKKEPGILARSFANRGYAVVSIGYRWPSEPFEQQMTQDAFCALAWVHANAQRYGFDAQRIAAFGDNWGAAIAAQLGAVDDPGPLLKGCPHPLPESNWIQGIVTYGGHFFTPEYSLTVGNFLQTFAKSSGMLSEMPYKELEKVFETLGGLPPREWRIGGEGLDEKASKIAPMLPLYWIDGSEPPFLLIDGELDLFFLSTVLSPEIAAESEVFAGELQAAGADVELLVLPDARWSSLSEEESSVDIVEATEAFLADVLD